MKKLGKRLSAIAMTALFASMQLSCYANVTNFDTGLGGTNGAVINNATAGLQNVTTGTNSATLNFTDSAHVNWNTFNINSGETMNFNAVGGANGLTVLNTVNTGMSKVYGTINTNAGIKQLIISNPNGMLYDGAHFNAAGDVMLSTQNMKNVNLNDLTGAYFEKLTADGKLIPIQIKDSTFASENGEFNIVAAGIAAENSTINGKAVKLVTANGQDYAALGLDAPGRLQTVTDLKAVNINGNLYITNDVGALEIANGGTINGKLTVKTDGDVFINKNHNGNKLTVTDDVNVTGNGAQMYFRSVDANKDFNATNSGGFLDVGNTNVSGNAKITTTDGKYYMTGTKPIKHFVHVVGDTTVGGNLEIEAKDNIHIGGYDYNQNKLADGSLTVGGDLTAHAKDGHVTTTIDTTAKNISLASDNYNVLTDDKAVLKADTYKFKSNGYIGGIKATDTMSADKQIVTLMENYIYIPSYIDSAAYTNIAGGTVAQIDANNGARAYIASQGDMEVTGANAGDVNLTSYGHKITISGDNVHANNINVGPETDVLKVEFPSRDYTLNYTNIRDEQIVTVNPNEVITYELTNGPQGYNTKDPRAPMTTYLVGPGAPGPGPTPNPNPNPLSDNDNVKVINPIPADPAKPLVNTPIAYAADLDDDEEDTGVRKNVDGSVTVVRAFPME